MLRILKYLKLKGVTDKSAHIRYLLICTCRSYYPKILLGALNSKII